MHKNSRKRWKPEDDEILLEKYGHIKLEKIAKKLGRHPESCRRRYYELTGSTAKNFATGYFTPPELAEIVGVDRWTVNYWINNKGLTYTEMINKRGLISANDFWKWIENGNKERINYKKYQEGILLPEPEWVKHKVTEAKKDTIKKGEWMLSEIKVLKFMFDNGESAKAVAKRLNRTIASVRWKKHELYS